MGGDNRGAIHGLVKGALSVAVSPLTLPESHHTHKKGQFRLWGGDASRVASVGRSRETDQKRRRRATSSSSSVLLSSLELSDTKVHGPQIRALLETASHFCQVVVLKLRTRSHI